MDGFVRVCALLLLLCVPGAHSYAHKDAVPVLVNTVGPFHNSVETYDYYKLPFCKPQSQKKDVQFGDTLSGDRRSESLYDIRFTVEQHWGLVCPKLTLDQNDVKLFLDAIKNNYMFEMFVDELSVKGFIGTVEKTFEQVDNHRHDKTRYFLFTHLDFSIAFNQNHVIALNLTTDPTQRIELKHGDDIENVEFSYSVHWTETKVSYIYRLAEHKRQQIADQAVEIHWLSIVNSFVLVILLTSFLALILMRVLKKDFSQLIDLDNDEIDNDDNETGWKLVHGDVFRVPPNAMLLSACIGTGVQILAIVISLLCLSLVGMFYADNRGALYSSAIFLYALTASIAGFVSSRLYVQLGGQRWATNAVLTASLYSVPFFVMFSFLNTLAVYYESTTALPFGTIFAIILLWALVTFPLTIIGAMKGRKTEKYDAPCKTNRVEREIPPAPWYRTFYVQLFMAGFLPFSAIYIEIHYIFASVWGPRVYTLFGILCLAYMMLIIVTAFITVALTYFQLAIEDYRWWWRSFFSGGSTGIFVYAYAIFFYSYRSEMNGVLQGSFFFGYVLMIAYAFVLMLGAVGFLTASKFVKYIFKSVKPD